MQIDITDIMRRHDTLGELCRMWDACRGTAPMPELGTLRAALDSVGFDSYFLLGGPRDAYLVKEMGAGFVRMSGLDVSGHPYLDRLPAAARDGAERLYLACHAQPCGMWGDYIATWPNHGRVSVTGLGLPLFDRATGHPHFIANVIPRPRSGIIPESTDQIAISKVDMDPLDTGSGIPW